MTARAVRLGLVIALLGLFACHNSGGMVPDPPFLGSKDQTFNDVVLIIIDTLRADHLGVYGSTQGLTPNLDAFAEQAVVFESAVAASSWTRPSIASIFTSRYPTSIGVLDKADLLSPDFPTLPETLRRQRNFETLGVYSNWNVTPDFGFGGGFEKYQQAQLRRSYPDGFEKPVAEGVTAMALDLLDRRDPGRPLLLFALYVDPHDPYLPHPQLLDEPEPSGRFDGSRAQLQRLDRLGDRAPAEDHDRIRYLYAGEVKHVDKWIGHLLAGLQDRGIFDESLIVITSDHGEGLWTHRLRGHGNDLYEESVHVPLLIKFPRRMKIQPARVAAPVSLVDIAPTVLASYSVSIPSSFQGGDLTALASGKNRGPAFDYIYTEMDHRGLAYEAIRSGPFKLIRMRPTARLTKGPRREVFDLSSDPLERRSIAARRNDLTKRLTEVLERWSLAVTATASRRSIVSLTELEDETRQSLLALGYLGEGDLAAEGEGAESAWAGSASDIPLEIPPSLRFSAVDLKASAPGWDQVIKGADPSAAESGGTPLRSSLAVALKRDPTHSRWKIKLRSRGRDARLAVQVDLGDATYFPLGEEGNYTVVGKLPEGTAEATRIDLASAKPKDIPILVESVSLE